MRQPHLLIVEDHPMMVDALCASLGLLLPSAVFLRAGSLQQGIEQLSLHPHIALLLLDLNLPDAQGVDTLQAFCDARPQGGILVFSVVDSLEIRQMCVANRVAFLSKTEPVTRLVEVVLQTLCSFDSVQPPSSLATSLLVQEPDIDRMQSLSERQLHVLSQLARGKKSREVALALAIEESTVRTHQISIYQRLGVKNKTQASAVYWQWAHRAGQQHG
jgi:DNA-binding NarL/FixJ family response regulator